MFKNSALQDVELHTLHCFHKALADNAKQAFSTQTMLENVPHVSHFVYDCLRRTYYSITTKYPVIDLRGAIRTWIGRKLHEVQILNGEMELNLYWENYLQGRLDEFDGHVLLDKKTTRFIPKKAYTHHFKQLELYKFLLAMNKRSVNNVIGCVLYIDVKNAKVKAFVQELKTPIEELKQEVLTKWSAVSRCIKNRILPPRTIQQWEPGSVNTVCHYCPFYGRCWFEDMSDTTTRGE